MKIIFSLSPLDFLAPKINPRKLFLKNLTGKSKIQGSGTHQIVRFRLAKYLECLRVEKASIIKKIMVYRYMSLMTIERNKIIQTLTKINWIKCSCKWAFKNLALTNDQINPRTPRGYHPLAFFPCNFFDDSNRENRLIVSVTSDGRHVWHMWHHFDAVTWYMSWRQMSMTVVKMHCFYHSLLIEISFDVDVINQLGWCRFQYNWACRIQKCLNKLRDLDGWPWNLRSNLLKLDHS